MTAIVIMLAGAPVALAEAPCPNAASRQGPSVGLPDCRVYEQVTPVNKGDATDLFPSRGIFNNETADRGYPSEDGNNFLLGALTASFVNGVTGSNIYVFSRGASGWTTTPIAPPGLGVQSVTPAVFNPSDLSQVGVVDEVESHANFGAEGPEYHGANLIGPPGGPYTTIAFEPAISEGVPTEIVGASADLSHVVLESRHHTLAPQASGQVEGSHALYEQVGGQLRLVNVSSGPLVNLCGATLGQGTKGSTQRSVEGGAHNAVSSDGSKIFFTAPDPRASGAGCWEESTIPQTNPPQLYMRLNGRTTVDISAPEPGINDPSGLQPAVYVGASANGSKVFFITKTELTADDTTHAPELYEYDTEAPEGKRLVRVSSGDSGNAEGSVNFVGAISTDGSTVYFTAFGQLAPGASALNEETNGQVNLYRYDTATKHTTYIAKVGGQDYSQQSGEILNIWYHHVFEGLDRPKELGSSADAEWYTTADGRYLVFVTKLDITGYDSKVAPGFGCEGLETSVANENCAEVFRYDAAAPEGKSVVCVSCGPPGVAQVDNALFARSATQHAPAGVPPRPISEDGSYVFFDTANVLVPQATSDRVHVYEWHEGAISLISSVGDAGNAFFLGSSADGRDVFFGTHAQLAAQDTDVSGDLYDARIGGGFVGLAPPACTGTGCQGVPAAPPIFATPASVTFEGVGDFPASSGASVKPTARGLTRAQKLAKALKACRAKHNKDKRTGCESQARKRYGSTHRANKSNRRGN